MKPRTTLHTRPKRFRTDVVRGIATGDHPVDRLGGDYGAGLIRGAAVITRGEALGHGLWIDRDFLKSVTEGMEENARGVKSRFTHPSLSGDGLGKALGRAKNGSLQGDLVRSDVHFTKSSHTAPDGDLAGHVMDLAEEDPELFGMSIVYTPDLDAERKFIEDHGGRYDDFGFPVVDAEGNIDGFKSPDPKNKENLPHARLEELNAVDAVDDPAANPDGLFHRGAGVAREADALLSYSLGLSRQRPRLAQLDVDPDRVMGFAQRFLTQHGLQLVPKQMEAAMPETNPTETKPSEETPVVTKPAEETTVVKPEEEKPKDETKGEPAGEQLSSGAPGKKFLDAFGDKGGVWFAQGKTFEQAQALYLNELKAEATALKEANQTLQTQLAASRGEASPVSFQAETTDQQKKANGYQTKIGTNLGRFAAGIKVPSRN